MNDTYILNKTQVRWRTYCNMQQQSAKSRLKEITAVGAVSFIAAGLITELAFPNADVIGSLGLLLGLMPPVVWGMLIIVAITMVVLAYISDYFRR